MTVIDLAVYVALLGLAAGWTAALLRIASGSLPWLRRALAWDAKGKPGSCSFCLGAWVAGVVAFTSNAIGVLPTSPLWLLGLPAAAAIAALVLERMAPVAHDLGLEAIDKRDPAP